MFPFGSGVFFGPNRLAAGVGMIVRRLPRVAARVSGGRRQVLAAVVGKDNSHLAKQGSSMETAAVFILFGWDAPAPRRSPAFCPLRWLTAGPNLAGERGQSGGILGAGGGRPN